MTRLMTVLFLCVACLLSTIARADTAEDLAAARSQLETLSPDDSEAQISRERYQQLISALENTLRYEKKAAEYRELIEQQPGQIAVLKKALEKPETLKPLKNLDRKSLSDLLQMQTVARARLLELDSAHSAAGKLVRENDDRQIRLREKLGQLREKADAGDRKADDEKVDPLLRQISHAQATALNARVQALELQLLVLPGQTELASLQLQQLAQQIAQYQPRVQLIEEAIQVRRRIEAEKALSELEKAPEAVELPPPLQAIQEQNQQLSDAVRAGLAESEQISTTRSELSKQLKKLDRSHRTIEQQLALDIGYLGGEMRRLMLRVTQPIDTRKTYARINQLRLQNLEQEQTELDAVDAEPLEVESEWQQQYDKLLADQTKLHRRLSKNRQQLISGLSELLTVQEAYNEQIRQSSELLNENLLWHPSVPAIDLGWPREIQRGIAEVYDHWLKVHEKPIWLFTPQLGGSLFGVVLASLLALILWRYRREHEELWYQQLGNVMQDRISHTLKLLVMAPVIAAPIPLLLLSLAQQGIDPAYPDANAAQRTLTLAAMVLWVSHTLYQWLSTPSGLFAGHLAVPDTLATILSRRLLSLFTLAMPLLVAGTWLDEISNDLIRSGLGRVMFIGIMVLLMLFWLSLWRQGRQLDSKRDASGWWVRSQFWLMLMVLTQLVGIGLSLWGYALTAGAMVVVLMLALLICLAVYSFYQIGLRWLLIEERKLAFARARARRAEILAARENNEEEPPHEEENLLDLQTISDQAKVLLKASSLILLVSLFWWQLGDLLPTLVVLDNIQLWSSTVSGEGGDILQPITLKNLLVGILVLGLSLLAAYNLPGLLELLVLRHVTLSPGTGYAITTMVKYLLILIGVTSGFSHLGFAWSKLQWLVAALGVGLGFGLQEIVANFVSGVIILFEKPVRIGDTVTVGNLTGTVTRIQMRATTITDWDRKEVIIPNKTFITDQLINWSLSDAVTRVVIPVGVAYGSDTALVRSLLLEVARNNDRLLDDPEPQAFFLGFGDSALNFDLRVYVAAMSDRLEVANELNNAIDAAFKKHGVDIPFPQMTVHLPEKSD